MCNTITHMQCYKKPLGRLCPAAAQAPLAPAAPLLCWLNFLVKPHQEPPWHLWEEKKTQKNYLHKYHNFYCSVHSFWRHIPKLHSYSLLRICAFFQFEFAWLWWFLCCFLRSESCSVQYFLPVKVLVHCNQDSLNSARKTQPTEFSLTLSKAFSHSISNFWFLFFLHPFQLLSFSCRM